MMRKFIDIIVESSFSPTDYGYWISQYGEVYPVGLHGHEAFVKSVEGCNSSQAMSDGWIRVVVSGVFQAEACFPKVKPRNRGKLVALARNGEYSSFIIDNHNGTGGYTVNQYSDLHSMIHGIEYLSRKLIEAKMSDGAYTAVLGSDLPRLLQRGDMRGVAVNNRIYLQYAGQETHYGMRGNLGLPSDGWQFSGNREDGFNFFIAPMSAYEGSSNDNYSDMEGRSDWMLSPADFQVGHIGIWVDHPKNYCLENNQFARMVQ